MVSEVSNIRKDSRAKVEKVDSPPQNPHVINNFTCGGISGFRTKYPNANPRIKLAITFTHNVAGAEPNLVLTRYMPVRYLSTAPNPPPANTAKILPKLFIQVL